MEYKIEIPYLIATVIKAGEAILEIYQSDFDVEFKSDQSPLTQADRKSHEIICEALSQTGFPVISEEGAATNFEIRRNWDRFWLVDPLDGTKEFVKRNGDFTVNIAFVEKGFPYFGIIYAPVPDIMYVGSGEIGAFKIDKASELENTIDWRDNCVALPVKNFNNTFTVVASRYHLSEETQIFIDQLKAEYPNIETRSVGSSLKLCLIAEGSADVYPRFAPTMEWDIAAGHAIINAAGGRLVQPDQTRFVYNKESLLNPWFVAYSGVKM